MTVKSDEKHADKRWPSRYLVIIFYVPIFLIGASSAYYLLENTNWQQMDSRLAAAGKMFYFFVVLLYAVIFLLLYWVASLKDRLEAFSLPQTKKMQAAKES